MTKLEQKKMWLMEHLATMFNNKSLLDRTRKDVINDAKRRMKQLKISMALDDEIWRLKEERREINKKLNEGCIEHFRNRIRLYKEIF